MKKIFTLIIVIFFITTSISTLKAQPQYYNYENVGTSNNSFPLGQAGGKKVQWLFLAGDFNLPTPVPAGKKITKIYLYTTYSATGTYTDLLIKIGQTTLTELTSGAFYAGQLDTVYYKASVSHTSTANSWLEIILDRPYVYDITKSLVVDISTCGNSGSAINVRQNVLSGVRRIWSVGGCPFAPYAGGDASMVNFGVAVVDAVVPNSSMVLPTPGVNTNYVSIPHNAAMVGFPNITIEAWVKLGATTVANTILNKGAASFDYQLGISAGGIPFFRAQSVIATSTGFTVTAGVWTHVAASFDGSNVLFYKDGVLVCTIPLAGTLGTSTNEMRIGRGNSDPGSGDIEELRLWSVVRTGTQINADKCKKWPSTFSSSTGLKALWHFDNSLIDSISAFNGTVNGTVTYNLFAFPDPGMSCSGVGIIPDNVVFRNTLNQNYPNPFNNSTTITYQLVSNSDVVLKVYDIMGKEVATLVNTNQKAGKYEVNFNTGNLSSGIYVYQLTTNNVSQTRRMMIEK